VEKRGKRKPLSNTLKKKKNKENNKTKNTGQLFVREKRKERKEKGCRRP